MTYRGRRSRRERAAHKGGLRKFADNPSDVWIAPNIAVQPVVEEDPNQTFGRWAGSHAVSETVDMLPLISVQRSPLISWQANRGAKTLDFCTVPRDRKPRGTSAHKPHFNENAALISAVLLRAGYGSDG